MNSASDTMQSGQGLFEYGIIISVVAVICVILLMLFEDEVSGMFSTVIANL